MTDPFVGVSTRAYGRSSGPPVEVPGSEITLDLRQSGFRVDVSARHLNPGESPNLVNVDLTEGGVRPFGAFNLLGSRYQAAGVGEDVMYIRDYQTKTGTDALVRLRTNGWDRWNGTAWLSLSGAALTGTVIDRYYTASMQDKFLGTNGVDKIKSWNGLDGGAVQDLSAGAPVCKYIAPFGQRLVAVNVKVAGSFDPYFVQWSADGLITDWTSAALGAGSAILEPEGSTGLPDFFKGASALETGLVLYRQRSIMIGLRTGIGAAPFKFLTPIVGLGTNSPYSIANGGLTVGDFFLGDDLNVYLFNGQQRPVPIGNPIWPLIRGSINNPDNVIGVVDRRRQRYALAFGTGANDDYLTEMWLFDIAAYLTKQRLSWTKVDLVGLLGARRHRAIGFGRTTPGTDPVVDTVTSLVDSTGQKVDEYSNVQTADRLLLGDDDGGVYNEDPNTYLQGTFDTMQFGPAASSITVNRVALTVDVLVTSQIEVSISVDGGQSFTKPRIYTLSPTSKAESVVYSPRLSGISPQVRIRFLSGSVRVSEVAIDAYPRGRAA